ncbi:MULTISPECIES: hypothetical protein [Arthrobacter]|uniref:hypothetical protein n=1 Tax=unclassified Arthrobacter TaxID=235627 RepID=UPI0024BA60FD|nr:hypothetical protein [Arthrobacter sp. H35-MC1]MDJ0316838.1 hypothetical protein [Arthrobacter sp. H35-MC1]
MLTYGFFEWIFWVLAFCTGILALARIEVFSTHSSQRVHRHSGQQILLWIMTIAFALSGFVTAALAMRAGY